MRIAVVDYYHPSIHFKDPGQITIGLREAGVDAFLVPLRPAASNGQAPFPIVAGDPGSDALWARAEADVVLVFSRLDPRHTTLLRRLKARGARIIVKADTDGTLGYPLVPHYLRALMFSHDPLGWIVRNAKWRMPVKTFVARKIEQIRLADAVIIESPDAVANVVRVLEYWGERHLAARLHFVPNPIAPDVCEAPLRQKDNVIVASGRWDDEGAKNTRVLVRVLGDFLQTRLDYRSVILGSGSERVNRLARPLGRDARARMDVRGAVTRRDVVETLSVARVCLVSSRLESFGLAGAEALCMGCSAVVTPIESLRYLSAQGATGTVARDFTPQALLTALREDVSKWEKRVYDPARIAGQWRPTLGRKEVARAILAIAEAIAEPRGAAPRTEFPSVS